MKYMTFGVRMGEAAQSSCGSARDLIFVKSVERGLIQYAQYKIIITMFSLNASSTKNVLKRNSLISLGRLT